MEDWWRKCERIFRPFSEGIAQILIEGSVEWCLFLARSVLSGLATLLDGI
jgi:hypothetical protein